MFTKNKRMSKNKLIIISKLFLLFVLVKINFHNKPKEQPKYLAHNTPQKPIPLITKPEPKTLCFASENIPTGNKKINFKMKRVLKANSFKNLQTHKLHNRAEKWFNVIEPILRKYGIPEDFKYIPLVETGLATNIYSPRGAAGLWQFMPQTGRDFGLTVNSSLDERFNINLSTVAAAKYFRSLYKIFGNWTLVAAAYNAGEGQILRQIKKQNESNYFNLKLNRETAIYVYSLISMKEIIEHPQMYGYKIRDTKWLAYQ